MKNEKPKRIGILGAGLSGIEYAKLVSENKNEVIPSRLHNADVMGETLVKDWYGLRNIIDRTKLYNYEGTQRNEGKHKLTCAKNRAKRKNKKRRKRK